ncbi:hypothetical protein P691DRAFT_805935 [Macrolepiota fuliginosa MF-IS2]|uniref:DUF6533 domain-containing protein n=1 Tax=Macrolepiota fuliginosa MF-IS2 TaxID=1400762 RepID=A0A9P5X698_9AGAR|nr:hypothetical protein P691DRAFT_805935 [Macrolepiota fuliginosa MF-IS2]
MDPSLEQTASHLLAGKYFQLAAFIMLVYDHLLTFDQEVERIWKQRLSAASVLFLVNRYLTIMEFIVVLEAFHNPRWKGEVCRKSVAFEASGTIALVAVGELIMILRVFAIYGRNIRLLVVLMALWLAQVIVSGAGLRRGFPVPLPPQLTGCILTGDGPLPSLWIAPLVTDSIIFFLTLYRAKRYASNGRFLASPTITILVRDGTIYFFLIFLANLANVSIYFSATRDLKDIGASFSQLITATMISRLVLNLRSASTSSSDEHQLPAPDSYQYGDRHDKRETLWTRTLGNLDGDISSGTTSGSGTETETKCMNVEVMTSTEVVRDIIPMERINDPYV